MYITHIVRADQVDLYTYCAVVHIECVQVYLARSNKYIQIHEAQRNNPCQYNTFWKHGLHKRPITVENKNHVAHTDAEDLCYLVRAEKYPVEQVAALWDSRLGTPEARNAIIQLRLRRPRCVAKVLAPFVVMLEIRRENCR